MPPTARDAVRRLEATRRANRGEQRDWLDASYELELRLLFIAIVIFGLPALFGGDVLSSSQLASFHDHARGILSIVVAAGVWAALRSGTRGGPLAPAAADVTYLLLAPIPRSFVLRRMAVRQVRAVATSGAVIGTAVGIAAAARLPGSTAGWALRDLGAGIAVAALIWGSVAIASGCRLRMRIVDLIGAALVTAATFDLVHRSAFAPTTWVAALGLSGYPNLSGALPIALGAVFCGVVALGALAAVGGVALELLARRSALVSQLRFAASLQDARSVVLLHRELAMEESRRRPWVSLPARTIVRHPAWRRGWHSYARWPTRRLARALVLSGAAIALALAARSTPLLVVVAGAAAFVVALDVIEPFAAELDHPTLLLTYGVPIRDLLGRNLSAPVAALVGFAASCAAVAIVLAPAHAALAIAVAVSAALGALAGSALNVALGPPTVNQLSLVMSLPEVYGIVLILRQVVPPALAAAGLAPIVVAAFSTTGDSSAITVAVASAAASTAALAYCCLRGV